MKLEKYKQRDPKKIGITIFTMVCVLLIAGVFFIPPLHPLKHMMNLIL